MSKKVGQKCLGYRTGGGHDKHRRGCITQNSTLEYAVLHNITLTYILPLITFLHYTTVQFLPVASLE